ncbi:hypothetical protein C1645_827711 [Glomus cerebriforme]|uniref:Uncharacterized protein n=1 Tax=Glomus cerebriforme TaxID=658196 RepID=A0A397SX71_9GLOM|nr:hypothetical protein C1645_827711 [Glomus cerebriforme]
MANNFSNSISSNQISEITLRLDHDAKSQVKSKRKGKGKSNDEFYQVAIKELAYEIFHKHKQPSDQTIKDHLKEKLENDEYCTSRLQKMHEKGVSFDLLWEDKLYLLMLTANRSKRGYYIRKIKESLWSTFEHTDANAMWIQAVLESIFDKNHLSTKINSEIYSDEHCETPPYSPSSNNNPMDNMSLDNDTLYITNVDDVEGVEPSNIGDLY